MIRVGHGSGEQHETLCGGGGTRVTPPIIGYHRRRRRVGPHPPSPRRFFPNDCIGAVAPWYIYIPVVDIPCTMDMVYRKGWCLWRVGEIIAESGKYDRHLPPGLQRSHTGTRPYEIYLFSTA